MNLDGSSLAASLAHVLGPLENLRPVSAISRPKQHIEKNNHWVNLILKENITFSFVFW